MRNPAKLNDVDRSKVEVIQGDVLDLSVVERAVAGQGAVLSALGAGAQRSTLRENGTRKILQAMEKAGVKRFISLSSLGVGDSRKNRNFFTKHIVIDIFLRHAFADHERQEALIRACSLDWTIVRPPHLVDGPRTGDYQNGFSTDHKAIQGKISRADVADFMLKQVSDPTYVKQSPGLSY